MDDQDHADGTGVGTILDDEVCAGPDLLLDSGAEAPVAGGEIPGWTALTGTFERRTTTPPAEGEAFLFAATASEFYQDVDVIASRLAAGGQVFAVDAWLRSAASSGRVVVEFRDAANTVVLGELDSGAAAGSAWQQVTEVGDGTNESGETYFVELFDLSSPGGAVLVAGTAGIGTVVFPAGTTSQTVTVDVLGDTMDEPAETFTVVLSSPVNVTLGDGEGLGTILDNDPPSEMSVTSVTVTEGPSVEAVFTVVLSAESSFDVTADYVTADATALAGLDYTATSGTLSLPAGTTSTTVSVPIADDALDEDAETFVLTFANRCTWCCPPFRALVRSTTTIRHRRSRSTM